MVVTSFESPRAAADHDDDARSETGGCDNVEDAPALEKETDLYFLSYYSYCHEPMSTVDFDVLVAQSQKRNSDLRISGALLFLNNIFFQILEGPKEATTALFAKIVNDTRHTNVTVVNARDATERILASTWHLLVVDPDLSGLWNSQLQMLQKVFEAAHCYSPPSVLACIKEGKNPLETLVMLELCTMVYFTIPPFEYPNLDAKMNFLTNFHEMIMSVAQMNTGEVFLTRGEAILVSFSGDETVKRAFRCAADTILGLRELGAISPNLDGPYKQVHATMSHSTVIAGNIGSERHRFVRSIVGKGVVHSKRVSALHKMNPGEGVPILCDESVVLAMVQTNCQLQLPLTLVDTGVGLKDSLGQVIRVYSGSFLPGDSTASDIVSGLALETFQTRIAKEQVPLQYDPESGEAGESLIKQLTYLSEATRVLSIEDLRAMVQKAAVFNKSKGITGSLQAINNCYLQTLEGPVEAVDQLIRNIRKDKRHTRVHTSRCLMIPETERSYRNWSMTLVEPECETSQLYSFLDGQTIMHIMFEAISRTLQQLAPYYPGRLVESVQDGAYDPFNSQALHAPACVMKFHVNFDQVLELRDPLSIYNFVNDYFNVIMNPINEMGGYLIHFLGEELLVYFPESDKSVFTLVALAKVVQTSVSDWLANHLEGQTYDCQVSMCMGQITEGTIGLTRRHVVILGDIIDAVEQLVVTEGLCGIMISSSVKDAMDTDPEFILNLPVLDLEQVLPTFYRINFPVDWVRQRAETFEIETRAHHPSAEEACASAAFAKELLYSRTPSRSVGTGSGSQQRDGVRVTQRSPSPGSWSDSNSGPAPVSDSSSVHTTMSNNYSAL